MDCVALDFYEEEPEDDGSGYGSFYICEDCKESIGNYVKVEYGGWLILCKDCETQRGMDV